MPRKPKEKIIKMEYRLSEGGISDDKLARAFAVLFEEALRDQRFEYKFIPQRKILNNNVANN